MWDTMMGGYSPIFKPDNNDPSPRTKDAKKAHTDMATLLKENWDAVSQLNHDLLLVLQDKLNSLVPSLNANSISRLDGPV